MIPFSVCSWNETEKCFELDVCAHDCDFFAIDKSTLQCALV